MFELCHEMHWTFEDYQRTPVYWQRVFWDLLQTRREAERAHHEREMRRIDGRR